MKIRDFLENFILVAIIFVIIHTFLQELAYYLHWSVLTRNVLIFFGLFFDFTFSAEFLVRSIFSARNGAVRRYWLYERGWVDFLSSIPLLVLDSGPTVFFLLAGAGHESFSTVGILNVLKVVKAIRVTRILRLVRIIKIFGKIHNAESKMAQHHTASIATTAVFSIVMTLIIFAVFTDSTGFKEIKNLKEHYSTHVAAVDALSKSEDISSGILLKKIFSDDTNILKIMQGHRTIVSRISDDDFKKNYSSDDYAEIKTGTTMVYLSLIDIHRRYALEHMQNFLIIIFVVISFMVVYTRHFVQNISDVVHILNKGFRKMDYNLQIKIREEFADEEIYRLARFYNNSYLPAKLKRMHAGEDRKKSALSMDDLMDFTKK